jgi:multidrug efflux pump subunit AcrA (membrane-fusion protein)
MGVEVKTKELAGKGLSARRLPAQPGMALGEHGILPAMQSALSPNSVRTLATLLVVLLLIGVGVLFTPWQQSIPGRGMVMALTPTERQQFIAAPVESRVLQWHVTEGSKVKAGDLIVELTDNDPQILDRIEEEKRLLTERRMNANGRVEAHLDRLGRLEESRANGISAARNRVEGALDRIRQAEQALTAAIERQTVARLNLTRQNGLFKSGLTSQRTVELAQQEQATADAEVRRSEAAVSAAKNEKRALDDDLRKIQADAEAAIEAERATLNMARSEVNNVGAELQRVDVRLARQQTMRVTAPRDGIVLRLLAQPNSELLKAGEPLVAFVPETITPVVELYVDGVDIPLVHSGDMVRLQFNGWPAIQFVGWPAVAVGTFGGKVTLVDATTSKAGKFRILVVPDTNDDPWPSGKYLRQGVEAKGWVLLKQVPLWWELWRQFNGFPQTIAEDEPGATGSKEKSKK